jgi:hypothetical protein
MKSANTIPVRWVAKLIDAEDGSGDKLIELPEELLSQMDLRIGDAVSVEVSDDKTAIFMAKATASHKTNN